MLPHFSVKIMMVIILIIITWYIFIVIVISESEVKILHLIWFNGVILIFCIKVCVVFKFKDHCHYYSEEKDEDEIHLPGPLESDHFKTTR